MSWYGEIRQWIAEKEIALLLPTQAPPAIYRIYGKYANAPLTGALKSKNFLVRVHAARALGEIGDVSAIPALIDVVKDRNGDRYLRGESVAALGKIGDASAVPALVDALKDERWNVRDDAVGVLAEIAEKSDIDLNLVRKALVEYVDSVKDAAGIRKAKSEASRRYMEISAAARKRAVEKHSLAGDGIILVGERPRPPSRDRRMYREGARAVA